MYQTATRLDAPLCGITIARAMTLPAGRKTLSIQAFMSCCRACRLRAGNFSSALPNAKILAGRILEKFDLSRYFRAVYADTVGSVQHSKTELLGRLIKEQSLDRTATCMVGDRYFDIEAARANGVTSIAVIYGYGTPGELEAAHPDYTCKAVEDLLPIITSLA